jgi:adenylate kinase
MTNNIIFLGPPGSGKGTQAKKLAVKLGIPHISMGDILREAVRNKTPMGEKIGAVLAAGNLVPDEMTIGITRERLSQADCNKGFILDGFPRTVAQGEGLAAILKELGKTIDSVIYFEVPLEVVIERLTGRRSCKNCGAVYHIKNMPSKKEGICDICGGELYLRDDDQPATIKNRFEVYNKSTSPLVAYYEAGGKLKKIHAGLPEKESYAELLDVMGLNG